MKESNDRLMYDKDAEMAVAGALLEEPEYMRRIPFLRADDFFDPDCGKVFKAYTESGETDISGIPRSKIIEYEDSIDSPAKIFGYAKTVKNWSLKRKIANIYDLNDLYEHETSPGEIIAKVKELERELPFTLTEHKPYTLDELTKDVKETPEGLRTGYKDLDEYITIPQEAITIIAGRPSHGKTTFLMNLCLKMVDLYSSKSFLFFSYEESKRQVGLKLLNILSGEVISEHQNLYQLENYLRGNNNGNPSIEGGKNRFKELTENERLWIIDEPYFVDELASIISYFNDKYAIGAVFIDYIQKVKIKDRYSTRQIELQKISEQILETAKGLSLPIILGAQLGRDKTRKDKVYLDNLREAGDIEQDAHLVLGLHNPAMEKAQDAMEGTQDKGEPLIDRKVELTITILKQRNGIVNIEVPLDFDRPILTIKDRDSGGW